MEGASAMTQMLTDIGSFFTQSVEWLGTIMDTITGDPALLIMCLAMPIIGFSVGLLGRLFRVG